jgi:hypothetical protein
MAEKPVNEMGDFWLPWLVSKSRYARGHACDVHVQGGRTKL